MRGEISDTFLASNITQVAVISGWNGSYGYMRPRVYVGHLTAVIGGCQMCNGSKTPKQSLKGVIFGLKSPCSHEAEGFFQQHVLGLQCHPSGCSFWLEWFVWINGIGVTCQMTSFGDGGHARCSMGRKRSIGRVFFSMKSPFLRGD